MRRLLDMTFVRYFACGCIAASLQVATLAVLVETARLEPVYASTIAFYFAVVVNYCLQRRFTFRSDEPHLKALPKFVAVSTLGAGINAVAFTLLSTVMHYVVAQALALLLVFSVNYALSRTLIFRTGSAGEAGGTEPARAAGRASSGK
ncbi:GtrA family protein [Ensifer sp. ENS09]|uniref:GtrA family protein n=1 Tax=Ensifer sp. ENS09 TaxID=2769263 RepID=UPI00199694A2|nr:GtrA family protein [Ensifer sp. ENS09]MBD9648154.1 GtrA family protein [Ensifer sp. ENS09]